MKKFSVIALLLVMPVVFAGCDFGLGQGRILNSPNSSVRSVSSMARLGSGSDFSIQGDGTNVSVMSGSLDNLHKLDLAGKSFRVVYVPYSGDSQATSFECAQVYTLNDASGGDVDKSFACASSVYYLPTKGGGPDGWLLGKYVNFRYSTVNGGNYYVRYTTGFEENPDREVYPPGITFENSGYFYVYAD